MRARLILLLVAAMGAAAAAVAGLRSGSANAPDAPGLKMCVSQVKASEWEVDSKPSGEFVAAFAPMLSDEQRKGLLEALEISITRWETRVNPLMEDFEEEDPDETLMTWLQSAPASVPLTTVASRSRWCGGDGLCVEVARDNAACAPGWGAANAGPDTERARFLAWPYGYAVLLKADSPAEAQRSADDLRKHARASARIGLVMHSTDEKRLKENAESKHLLDRFAYRETIRRLGLGQTSGDAGTSGRSTGIELTPSEVLVLPQLRALGEAAKLREEIAAAAPKLREAKGR